MLLAKKTSIFPTARPSREKDLRFYLARNNRNHVNVMQTRVEACIAPRERQREGKGEEKLSSGEACVILSGISVR